MDGAAHQGRTADASQSNALAFMLLLFLVMALQFGPLIGLLGFRLTKDAQWALNGVARDAAILALVALAALSSAKSRRLPLPVSTWWAFGLVAAYSLLSLLSSPGVFVLALNLRRLVLVPLLFVAATVIPWTPRQFERLFGLIAITSVIVAVLGIAERFGPGALWTDLLDIESFTAANGFDRFGRIPFENNGRFFSWDLEQWTGGPWRRAISSYLEPTTLAAGMAAALVIGLARQARGHGSLLLLLPALLCGALTMSKGFWLFLAILAFWRMTGVPSPRHILPITAVGIVAALVLAGRDFVEGPFAHLAGVQTSLGYLLEGNLLGEGIGEAGNYTNADIEVGSESGLGNAIAQTGLAALLPLFWLRAIASDVLSRASHLRDPGGPLIATWALFWIVSYVFSASSQGVGGNALGFLMLAIYINPSIHRGAA